MLNCVWLPECVSINSYKWLLTEQDAFCWHVSQCHQFNSLWALSSASRLLSTHTSAQTKFMQTNTHMQQMHTPMYAHIHRSARITVRGVSTSWQTEQATYMCQQFPFTWGQRRGEEEKERKNCRRWWGRYQLFIYMEHLFWGKQNKRKKRFYSLPYCRDDRFIVSIKKRICNKDPCLIAIEKLKTLWDGNLQWSSLFFPLSACGRSPNSLWGFNPIKKTIIYVRTVPEESARPLFSITQA